jgi:hypothetical protein
MVNNQLKIIKKRGHWLGEKAHLKKKNRSQTGFAGSRVNRVFAYPGLLPYPN